MKGDEYLRKNRRKIVFGGVVLVSLIVLILSFIDARIGIPEGIAITLAIIFFFMLDTTVNYP